ncbi:hypothetical protein TI39_contig272g00012 [Zymoseptoria brevis]|uniref:Uncharacterized protein n=1 Tax=Zymoseptoria brevis TaxID=1047168 RepID=A0A0F4GWU9_9PEZI|nr:hypothetical protein TI39_contig272g00012 [Zymoseptoria brevis]
MPVETNERGSDCKISKFELRESPHGSHYRSINSELSFRDWRLMYSRAKETGWVNVSCGPKPVEETAVEKDKPVGRSSEVKSVIERARHRHAVETSTEFAMSDCVRPAVLHAPLPKENSTGQTRAMNPESWGAHGRHEGKAQSAHYKEPVPVAQHQEPGSAFQESTFAAMRVPETGSLEHLRQMRARALATNTSGIANPIQREIARRLVLQEMIARRPACFDIHRKIEDFLRTSKGSPAEWRTYVLGKHYSKLKYNEAAHGMQKKGGAGSKSSNVKRRSIAKLHQVFSGRILALYRKVGVRSVTVKPYTEIAKAIRMPDLRCSIKTESRVGPRREALIRSEQRQRDKMHAAISSKRAAWHWIGM